MSVAKVIEITSESPESFETAIRDGITRASKNLERIQGAWIKEQRVMVHNNKVTGFRVLMKVTFVLND